MPAPLPDMPLPLSLPDPPALLLLPLLLPELPPLDDDPPEELCANDVALTQVPTASAAARVTKRCDLVMCHRPLPPRHSRARIALPTRLLGTRARASRGLMEQKRL